MSDPIRAPDHYLIGGLEVTRDILHSKMTPEAYRGYLFGTIMSYMFRHQWKGDPLTDLMKAQINLEWLIDDYQSENKAKEE